MNKKFRLAMSAVFSISFLMTASQFSSVMASEDIILDEDAWVIVSESPEELGDLYPEEDFSFSPDNAEAMVENDMAFSDDEALGEVIVIDLDMEVVDDADDEPLPAEDVPVSDDDEIGLLDDMDFDGLITILEDTEEVEEAEEAEDLPFAAGYAAVRPGTVCYAGAAEEVKGTLEDYAVVYAELYLPQDQPENDWFLVFFAAADNETGETVIDQAFVKRGELTELSGEDLDGYFETLNADDTLSVLDFNGYYLAEVRISGNEEIVSETEAAAEEIAAENAPEAEEAEEFATENAPEAEEAEELGTENAPEAEETEETAAENAPETEEAEEIAAENEPQDEENAVFTAVEPFVTVNNVIYELSEEKMRVVGYEGDDSSYVVEEAVEGYMVTEIAEGAFENNTNLQSIDLPDTIEKIGQRAFAGCTNLSSMS